LACGQVVGGRFSVVGRQFKIQNAKFKIDAFMLLLISELCRAYGTRILLIAIPAFRSLRYAPCWAKLWSRLRRLDFRQIEPKPATMQPFTTD
jgi:hypothetical protein